MRRRSWWLKDWRRWTRRTENSRAVGVRCAAYRCRRVDRVEPGSTQQRQGLRAGRRRQGRVLVWTSLRPFSEGCRSGRLDAGTPPDVLKDRSQCALCSPAARCDGGLAAPEQLGWVEFRETARDRCVFDRHPRLRVTQCPRARLSMAVVTVCSRRSSSWSDLGAVRPKRSPKAASGTVPTAQLPAPDFRTASNDQDTTTSTGGRAPFSARNGAPVRGDP